MPTGCLGCGVVAGSVESPGGPIHEDDAWLLAHLPDPKLRGWLLLWTKRHVEHVGELSSREAKLLGPLLRDAAHALAAATGAERVHALSLGDETPHVHWMLLPRAPGAPHGVDLIRLALAPERPLACSVDEAADVSARVRDALAR